MFVKSYGRFTCIISSAVGSYPFLKVCLALMSNILIINGKILEMFQFHQGCWSWRRMSKGTHLIYVKVSMFNCLGVRTAYTTHFFQGLRQWGNCSAPHTQRASHQQIVVCFSVWNDLHFFLPWPRPFHTGFLPQVQCCQDVFPASPQHHDTQVFLDHSVILPKPALLQCFEKVAAKMGWLLCV